MIVWADLETTGLDERKGSILEIALVATDDNLERIGDPFVSLVRPLHMRGLEVMDDYVIKMHWASGLFQRIWKIDELAEPTATSVTLQEDLPRRGDVERAAIEWCIGVVQQAGIKDSAATTDRKKTWPVTEYAKELKATPLAGNSVHFDKAWLREHMDDFEKLFSHRIFDVSVMTEWTKRFAPEVYAKRPGLDENGKPIPRHRALDDVLASIETAKYYRAHSSWSAG